MITEQIQLRATLCLLRALCVTYLMKEIYFTKNTKETQRSQSKYNFVQLCAFSVPLCNLNKDVFLINEEL